jgi:hypothetical protein
MSLLIALLITLFNVSLTFAATARPDPNRAFVDSCILAFDSSSSNGSVGVGRQICECTVKESKHEGVSRKALARETARIKQDPKYRIQDQKLLNALQYCSIQILKD